MTSVENMDFGQPLTSEEKKRAATAPIAGYLYQFDRTIQYALREQDHGALVRVEGLEDFDILSNGILSAHQVKYYSSQAYGSSKTIREPVMQMLKSFAAGRKWNYVIHIYLKKGEPPTSLDLGDLKNCLTEEKEDGNGNRKTVYHYKEGGYDDDLLEDFCKHLRIESAKEYKAHQRETEELISRALGCDINDARNLYRPLAVEYIQSISVNKSEDSRTFTRNSLMEKLAIKDNLYSKWHRAIIGQDNYLQYLSKELKKKFGKGTRERAVSINLSEVSLEELLEVTEFFAKDYSQSRRLYDRRPWTLIIEGESNEVKEAKAYIIDNGIIVNDGYEEISFRQEAFTSSPVITTKGRNHIIDKVSYSVRIANGQTLARSPAVQGFSDHILAFGGAEPSCPRVARKGVIRLGEISFSDLMTLLEGLSR